MIFRILTVGPIETNCYILGDERSKKAVVIDAGGEFGKIIKIIESLNLKLEKLINTHGHADHIGAVKQMQDKYDVKFYLNEKDLYLMKSYSEISGYLGLSEKNPPKVDGYLKEGEIIRIGEIEIKAIHTPGHTPGSMVFLIEKEKILLSGDTLFEGSVGRTDLPGGSARELALSLKKITLLKNDIRVFPGHGEKTTIEKEKKYNIFMRG